MTNEWLRDSWTLTYVGIVWNAGGHRRQWRHKNAGLKTNALVSVGATSFGLIALGSFGPGGNPTQIAAGVTGIGFIHLNLHFVTFVIAGDIGRIETD